MVEEIKKIENNEKSQFETKDKILSLENKIKNSIINWYEKIDNLIKYASTSSRNELLNSLKKSEIKLTNWETYENLSSYMIELRNLRESTMWTITSLKEELNIEKIKDFIKEIKQEDLSPISKRLFPNVNEKILSNPNWLKENLIAFSIWWIENIYSIVKITFEIWYWIILSPYHIYQIISWKRTYDKIKEI